MMMSDFTFWLMQQPPDIQQKTILQFIGLFAIMLVVGGIADYIKSKKKNRTRTVDKIRQM